MPAYKIQNLDAVLFSEALGVISRVGTTWSGWAAKAKTLEQSGKICVDPDDRDIQKGALGVTDAPASGSSRRIRLNPTIMSGQFGGSRLPVRVHTDKATLIAGILIHEMWHWDNGYSEPPAWEQERNFWTALYRYEIQQANGNNQSPRALAVYAIGHGREDEGSSYLQGRWFP